MSVDLTHYLGIGIKLSDDPDFDFYENVIDKKLSAPNKEDLIDYLTIVKKYVPNASLRGID